MNKREDKTIKIYANDFLKQFRKKNIILTNKIQQQIIQEQLSSKQIKNSNQAIQIQMGSDSQMQAQQLFGNIIPVSPLIQKNAKQVKKVKQPKSQTKIIDQQKRRSFIESQQKKVNNTKSILRKGKIPTNQLDQKQEQKIQQQQSVPIKQRKSVSFQGLIPLNAQLDKKWKDPIQNQKKGKFDREEEKILSDAVGRFLISNDISLQEFQEALVSSEKTQKFSRTKKIFALLSTVLPKRSPQSCYKFLKRNFNSLNRKGKWSEDEVDKLKILFQKYGRKWTIIGKQLKRSADNCYDKFRQLGQDNMQEKLKGVWAFNQLVQLLKLIQKMTKIKFLDKGLDAQLLRDQFHNAKQRQDVASRKYNSKNFIFHNITVLKPFLNIKYFQKIDISQIKWNQISNHLKTRNILDCRNKVIQLLQIFFHSAAKQLDQQVIEFLIDQKYQSLHEVNWKDWKSKQSTSEQAKNRFLILKKMVQGRSVKPFKTVLFQLKQRIQKHKDSSLNRNK